MDPQPSTTLVNVAEHAELRLVQLLAESAPPSLLSPTFSSDCESRIASADAPGLIRCVLRDPGAMTSLFAIEPIDGAVSAFSLLAALLDRASADGGPSESSDLCEEMAEAVSRDNASYDPRKRAGMLCALYNLRPDGAERVRLLARIASLCSVSDPRSLSSGRPLGDALDPDAVRRMCEGWGVGGRERRDLYRAAADGIGRAAVTGGVESGEAARRRQRFLLLLVGTYQDPSEINGEALASAKDAAVGAIQDPVTLFSEQRSMLLMPAVAALAENPKTLPLLSLLKVFQEGKLEDYDAYSKTPSSTEVLAQYGLSHESCVRNMRLLSLCSLAAEHEEIPYSAIAATLRVPSEDVEGWVIAAVSSGLLTAKMDQLRGAVTVERCVVRRFGPDQWRSLKGRLDLWKRNVGGVLDGLKKAQQ